MQGVYLNTSQMQLIYSPTMSYNMVSLSSGIKPHQRGCRTIVLWSQRWIAVIDLCLSPSGTMMGYFHIKQWRVSCPVMSHVHVCKPQRRESLFSCEVCWLFEATLSGCCKSRVKPRTPNCDQMYHVVFDNNMVVIILYKEEILQGRVQPTRQGKCLGSTVP